MNLKKNTDYKLLNKARCLIVYIVLITTSYADGYWVKYGWELFENVTDARTSALGQATVAYPFISPTNSIINPAFSSIRAESYSLTHQSRFAGILNNDLVGFQIDRAKTPLMVNILYEGIGQIPDTRNMLLDWGNDGQFGTNDPGEGNGILDEGERLDADQLKYFSQHQVGLHIGFQQYIKETPVGVGLKVLSSTLGEYGAVGIGLDFGITKSFKGNTLGLVIRNVPASGLIWSNGTLEGTTPRATIGLHRSIQFQKVPIKLHSMFQSDFSTSSRHLDSQVGVGVFSMDASYGLEAIYKDKLFFRFGRNSLKNTTGGLGVQWPGFGFDYAFQLTQTIEGLGNHHLISLNMTGEWVKDKLGRLQ